MSTTAQKSQTKATSKASSASRGRKSTTTTPKVVTKPQGPARSLTGNALAAAITTATTYAELAKACGADLKDERFAKAVHFHAQGSRPLSAAAIGEEKRDMLLAGVASSAWTRPRVKGDRLFNQPKLKAEPKPKPEAIEA